MLITKDMICIDADLKDKEKIIRAVAERMDRAGKLADQEGYIREVFTREGEISTNLGDGIAMPHARTAHVKEAGLVFLRLKDEVQWEEGSAPVKIIFGIAAPESGGDMHLKILASLARKLIYEEFKQKLFQAESEEELLTVIEGATGGLR